MPDPRLTPGPATTTRTRRDARIAYASVAAALSDWALMAVPTRTDEHAGPADFVEMARRVKLLGQHMQFLGVVMMLEEGREWGEVAQACGFRDERNRPDAAAAKTIYESKYDSWMHGEGDAWTPPGIRSAVPASTHGDPDAEAALLDEWYIQRSQGDGSLVPGLRPVTDWLY